MIRRPVKDDADKFYVIKPCVESRRTTTISNFNVFLVYNHSTRRFVLCVTPLH